MLAFGPSFDSDPAHLKLARALRTAWGDHDWAIDIEEFLSQPVAFHVERRVGARRCMSLTAQAVLDMPEAEIGRASCRERVFGRV